MMVGVGMKEKMSGDVAAEGRGSQRGVIRAKVG